MRANDQRETGGEPKKPSAHVAPSTTSPPAATSAAQHESVGKTRSSDDVHTAGNESTQTYASASAAAASSTALVQRNPHVTVRTRPPATLQQQQGSGGALLPLNPTTRRVAISLGKAGISIADGLLLSCNAILNPIVSASFVVYESVKVVQAYRHGDLNRLGYHTTKGDVALRIGKELTMTGVGIAIGQGIGALVGLSGIPVAGQLVVATLLSVGLGICVGTLVTHYVDRFTARLQLRHQYGYPADERGTRRRFEVLLERRHDLSTLETCRVVQHYADYRVACGWESANDLDDYRASGDITQMPVSLQHFAVVQLQRKWGFVKVRAQCRQIYRALLLVHHPDRGGSTEMAAQLNKDFEFFAFCQGWDGDCVSLLRGGETHNNTDAAIPASGGPAARRSRGSVVVDYLRSLFRNDTNSHVGANDLHQFGLLTLEAGTPADMHRLDVTVSSLSSSTRPLDSRPHHSNSHSRDGTTSVSDEDEEDDDDIDGSGVTAAVRQRSVTRVLNSLHEAYAATAELITFAGLVRVSDDAQAWARLHDDVSLFQRLQYFISVHTLAGDSRGERRSADEESAAALKADPSPPLVFHGFRWSTAEEAVARREEVRRAIVAAVFTEETSQQLAFLLDLWRTAKAVAESYFRACQQQDGIDGALTESGRGGPHKDEGRETLDTLLRIHKQLDAAGEAARGSWHGRLEEWATRTAPGFSSFMEDVKEVGLTASNALAAEYSMHTLPSEQDQCLEYCKSWTRKQDTLQSLLSELQLAYAERKASAASSDDLARRMDDYQAQLLLLHKQMAVVDVGIAEWGGACAAHFPELTPTLRWLPSTCLQAVALWPAEAPSALPSRFVAFERERTLLHYSRVEQEPSNPFEPFTARAVSTTPPADLLSQDATVVKDDDAETILTSFEVDRKVEDAVVSRDGVGMALLQAVYNDPLTGEITPCWLKRYSFPSFPPTSTDEPDAATAANIRRLAHTIVAEEVVTSEQCSSDRIVSARDVFYHRERHELFVHYVRGATQQRFRSSNDVRRQVEPIGLRWLHDVLECVICLHTCHLAHGQLCLSSFTYDDFGNTALGTFSPAWNGTNASALRRSVGPLNDKQSAPAPVTLAERQRCDTVDLGIMLLTEVLPLLAGARTAAGATPTTSPTSKQSQASELGSEEDVARVMEAVASHLVGKEEPLWSLLDARKFVRRFLQLRLGDVAVFSKHVAYPSQWAVRGPIPPVQLVAANVAHFNFTALPSAARVRVYQNRHLSLWETYWRCRRKMVALHHSTFMQPSAVAQAPALLFCSDDYEVHERYLWAPCEDEATAWECCQDGFRYLQRRATPLTPDDDMAAFALCAPSPAQGQTVWGVVCRVALGTTVEETQEELETAKSAADTSTAQYNKLSYAAQRRSHFSPPRQPPPLSSRLWVPSPWARCYPEFFVQLSL
ncbi:hypothetical protein ABB37_06193 [Leptomonas pyrrhocoris]|uniref:Protein kinase domain-containing protein n=1 Tax=Leptomonas pyrrhocoris TaxID=157538 RepID=A0A0M9FYJ1_LEPPY|nr:hypothetical protein ABB37_06193 [Leptomonas pyrrhocoris]KPA78593.1 hypothetical protein ABB37_06193 [Leptomonas pyrrhocoris]|eukprot:XP_015657032.1 hypothetical protein ABB37_06193 [Leptomonas pyrrhocoris]